MAMPSTEELRQSYSIERTAAEMVHENFKNTYDILKASGSKNRKRLKQLKIAISELESFVVFLNESIAELDSGISNSNGLSVWGAH